MLNFNIHHVNGLFFELLDDGGKCLEYEVIISDRANGVVVFETKLKTFSWLRLPRRYLSDLTVSVSHEGVLLKQIHLLDELAGHKVFIVFESESLGDNIAWIPYCLEFQEKYKCKVIVSTFKNHLFETVYPELDFVGRGITVDGLKAMVQVGWFWDLNKEPAHPVTIPLQQTASNILCLPFKEIRPRLAFSPKERPIKDKYICISTRSTAQCKHWYYWRELVQALKVKGYRVIELSQEADDWGAERLEDNSLQNVMQYLYHAEHYVGLSSGISWLNWAVGRYTIMISNFSAANHEFQSQCTRVNDIDVCHGCWNNPLYYFDKADWNWCPVHAGTSRHFECHRSIKPEVILSLIPSIE